MTGGSRRWAGMALVGIVVAPVVAGLVLSSLAAAEVLGATLPTERSATSAVWDGSKAYVFGGVGNGETDQIVSYDPSTGSVEVVRSVLPQALQSTAAVWTGNVAYLFGGHPKTDRIVRIDPANGTVAVVAARLPFAMSNIAAAWDGHRVYLFGGYSTRAHDTVLSYDPATDTLERMNASLPTPLYGSSAVWDGNRIVVFGDASTRNIYKYDPGTDTVSTAAARLPSPRQLTAAVFDGRYAYVFGGYSGYRPSIGEILQYDSAADTLRTLGLHLSSGIDGPSAVWSGSNAYLFGGSTGQPLKVIQRFSGAVLREETPPVTPAATSASAAGPTSPAPQPSPAPPPEVNLASATLPDTKIGNALKSHPDILVHAQQFERASTAYGSTVQSGLSGVNSVLGIRTFLQSQQAFGHSAWEAVQTDPTVSSTFEGLDQTKGMLEDALSSLRELEGASSSVRTSVESYALSPSPESERNVATAFGAAIPAYNAVALKLEDAAANVDQVASAVQALDGALAGHENDAFVGGFFKSAVQTTNQVSTSVSSIANSLRQPTSALHGDADVMSSAIQTQTKGLPFVDGGGLLAAVVVASVALGRRRKVV